MEASEKLPQPCCLTPCLTCSCLLDLNPTSPPLPLSRQSLEAGVRVRTGQLGEVSALLLPLALALQQGLMLVRQAFRASIAPGGQQGCMTLQHLVRGG